MAPYEFLDHPSEELIRVTAKTEKEVFAEAASALFELMTDTKKLIPERSFPIEISAPDKELLLIDWLNRLILLHEVEHVFLNQFEVSLNTTFGWIISATVRGQKISEEMEKRLHVKSATYAQLNWKQTPDGHQVQFVVDV
jgi:protein archease